MVEQNNYTDDGVDRVAAVVEELSERATDPESPCLLPVDCVKGLVGKHAEARPTGEPNWRHLGHRQIVEADDDHRR